MKYYARYIPQRVAIVGCKHTTQEFMSGLEKLGFIVDHCITISEKKAKEQKVAGYKDLKPFLDERKINYTVVDTYSLQSTKDKEMLLRLNIDLALVIGWQRLLPGWFLSSLHIGAFGMHGSSKPLPFGRGRSPMNWSLIQGKKIFYTHLFKYELGVDDGSIVDVQLFDINEHDTCLTLHFKNTVAMTKLCAKHLLFLLEGNYTLTPQPKEGATYYPKRSEEDGLIYWEDSTEEIYNLIRAVTKPFPGAFTYLNDDSTKKICIWKAQPFDKKLLYNNEVGEIVEVFSNGMFVVKTGDATMLVTEFEGYDFTTEDTGKVLGNLHTPRKTWINLPH